MTDINIENFKKLIFQNKINQVTQFIEDFININKKSFTNLNTENLDTKLIIEEIVLLINHIKSTSETEKDLIKNLKTILSKNNLQIEELLNTFYNIISNLDKKNLSNNLINHNWQLSIKERESSNNANKLDKVEIAMQFNSFDNKIGHHRQDLIKMNYYEFNEIFQNLKKIDSQLHLFKN
jgi:allophanate hydrolase subunit 1